jgi:hypothetical protein
MNTMSNFIASRKFAWGAGIVLTAWYFGPSIVHSFIPAPHAPVLQQKMAKPSPGIPAAPSIPVSTAAVPLAVGISASAPAPVAPSPPAAAAGDPAMARFLGNFAGAIALKRGNCSLSLAVRDSHDKDHPFAGFSSLSCAPTMFEMLDKGAAHARTPAGMVDYMTKQMNPTTAILEGSLVNGSLQFKAKENFAVTEVSNGCAMSSLTLTPFAEQMQVDWKESQEGLCQGGQVVLTRDPRYK